jgi:hypothetical protein
MRGFGGFSVRGEFAVRRREANENFFFFLERVIGELKSQASDYCGLIKSRLNSRRTDGD